MGNFDKKKFAELLALAKGNRSINQYALQCGVSSAHISRLLRGLVDTPPNPETIKKFASKAQNGVTYEELMEAAGHINSSSQAIKQDQPNEWQPQLTEKDKKDIAKTLEEWMKDLTSAEGLAFFNGEPVDEETKEYLKDSFEMILKHARLMNKKKYTPKKYRK